MMLRRSMQLFALIIAPLVFMPVMAAVTDEIRDAIETSLQPVLMGETPKSIEATSMEGIYKVNLGMGRFLYSNASGSHMISGEMYGFSSEGLVNLTEMDRGAERKEQLASLDIKNAIVFAPKGKPKAILNVFTDVDCGYCRLFHKEVPALNAQGVEVRYLAFPRGGLQTQGAAKMISAWCADDRQKAITDLKNEKSIPTELCKDNPVADQYRLGNEVGVTGTPSLLLMDGTMIPGYKPAAELIEILGIN